MKSDALSEISGGRIASKCPHLAFRAAFTIKGLGEVGGRGRQNTPPTAGPFFFFFFFFFFSLHVMSATASEMLYARIDNREAAARRWMWMRRQLRPQRHGRDQHDRNPAADIEEQSRTPGL